MLDKSLHKLLVQQLKNAGVDMAQIRDTSLQVLIDQVNTTYLATGQGLDQHGNCAPHTPKLKLNHGQASITMYDFLTGLPNRNNYYAQLQEQLHGHKQTSCGAVLYFDLDRFKTVNDSLGHRLGDALLVAVSQRISGILNDHEILARMGGDEFTVVLYHAINKNDVIDCAERILNAFDRPFVVDHHEIEIKTSIGISTYPCDSTSVDDLTQYADTALYDAKNRGGNGYRFFSQSLKHSVLYNFKIEQELRKAITQNQLALFYQPQVEHRSGKIVSVEALLRWQIDGDYISPEVFVPIAEATGLIHELGLWVLDAACRQYKKWLDNGMKLNRIAVNLSKVQLGDPAFADKVLQLLFQHQIAGTQLEFEITENAVSENRRVAKDNIQQLTDAKIWLSVDDFGTGESSFSNLRRFPFKSLKIDKSFVAGIGKNLNDEVIIRTTMAMANELELEVVAEGVENYTQMVFLTDVGCHYQQGFYFAKPLPPNRLNLSEVTNKMRIFSDQHTG